MGELTELGPVQDMLKLQWTSYPSTGMDDKMGKRGKLKGNHCSC